MDQLVVFTVYAICAVIVVVYAISRFNTPPTNRSSTRRRLYLEAIRGYIAICVLEFISLSIALRLVGLREAFFAGIGNIPFVSKLVDSKTVTAVPTPFLAMILMTTLASRVPYISAFDRWVLEQFCRRADIPNNVRNRAARLSPGCYRLSTDDAARVTEMLQVDGRYEELPKFLRAEPGSGFEGSEYRLTQVLRLYQVAVEFAKIPICRRTYFRDFSESWEKVGDGFRAYCSRATTGLTEAAALRKELPETEYEERIRSRREDFAAASAAMFDAIVPFVVGAILSLHDTETEIGQALRAAGFDVADEQEKSDFPLNSLTGLAIGLLLFLFVTDTAMRNLSEIPIIPPSNIRAAVPFNAAPLAIVVFHMLAIGPMVWYLLRFPAKDSPPEHPRWTVYLSCVLAGSVIVGMVLFVLFVAQFHTIPDQGREANMIIGISVIMGALCFPVAFFSESRVIGSKNELLKRGLEAFGCAAFMGIVAFLVMLRLPPPAPPQALPFWFHAIMNLILPVVSATFGFFVPHIIRREKAIARARGQPVSDRELP